MLVLGITLLVSGLACLSVSASPIRMSIERRATLMSIGMLVLYAGLTVYAGATTPQLLDFSSVAFVTLIMLALAAFTREAVVRRMRAARREWPGRWSNVLTNPVVRTLFMRYLDVD